ncbi:MAG: hypothetical protein SOY58_03165 [Candidatus Onthovivens sp.]|nr:hypothetical protein [Candidatus Onthovivens sp.]
MKKSKKAKIVLFNVIGLAAISIGTVGFATWITGIESKTDAETLTVTVDYSKNTTCIVEATLSDATIHVGEHVEKSAENLIYNDGEAEDLEITFSKFVVISSPDVNISKVNLNIGGEATTTSISNCSIIDNGVVPTNLYEGKENTDKKSYFKLSQSELGTTVIKNGLYLTTMADTDSNYVSGYNCYTLSSMTLSFSWGSLFNNDSPCTYYNEQLKTIEPTSDKLKNMQEYNKILNQMYSNLSATGNKLTLTITVETAA